ncbi:MAG: NAD(P)-dependent oxidoreductase [Salegentibacter sp.]
MRKFNKIVCVDNTKLKDWALEELQHYSEQEISCYGDTPDSKEEILQRIGEAEAVLVSWRTQIGEEVIKNCPNLKYIGMACSLYDDDSANVAVKFAREKDITVTGIRDYGDPGVVEFIVSELVRLLHGFGNQQWKEEPVELSGRKVGIIGLGTTGQLLAKALLALDVQVFYFSRSRKKEWEKKGVEYLSLAQLLENTEIISIHLPKNTKLMKEEEFQHFGNGKVLVNTSLGLPFEQEAFSDWIKDLSNFAIFDADGKKELAGGREGLENIITSEKSAGWSAETQQRLSEKVLENLKNFLM